MFNKTMVRISEIVIERFKNTEYGHIKMPSANSKDIFSNKADILGIYGQNGSGKTAVIEAMEFIQTLLTGHPLPRDTVNYIRQGADNCTIAVKFLVGVKNNTAMVEYLVQINKIQDNELKISRETLSAAAWNGTKFENKKTLIDYRSHYHGLIFTPKYRYDELVRKSPENLVNLSVARKISQKDLVSFIFSTEGRSVFLANPDDINKEYGYIITALNHYATVNLFVISNRHSGTISLNFLIPVAFRLEHETSITKGDLGVRLDEPSIVTHEEFDMINQILAGMNEVLKTLIPGLSIGIHDHGKQLLEDGTEGRRFELLSKRGGNTLPLRYESEGIIKIISVLHALMCVYTNPAMGLIIDELDSGVFEYLFGELLSVFEKGAKGQLIFTSHNLRPLEMLNKNSILFSTTNPNNRYIRMQSIKNNHNLRDTYLRSILLSGQKEDIYEETDSVEIGRAFRRAGKAVCCGDQD